MKKLLISSLLLVIVTVSGCQTTSGQGKGHGNMSSQFEIMMCNGLKIGFPGYLEGEGEVKHDVPTVPASTPK